MEIGALYIITFHGDLEMSPATVHRCLEDALESLRSRFPAAPTGQGFYDGVPDPEDDRIVIWKASAERPLRAVWHFSGWHWDPEARDLPGGPLAQGSLPGHEMSLYDLAVTE